MKFFVDTAEIDAIAELNDLGMVDGVTTNPSLILKSGPDILEVTREIAAMVDGPVSAVLRRRAGPIPLDVGREIRWLWSARSARSNRSDRGGQG